MRLPRVDSWLKLRVVSPSRKWKKIDLCLRRSCRFYPDLIQAALDLRVRFRREWPSQRGVDVFLKMRRFLGAGYYRVYMEKG